MSHAVRAPVSQPTGAAPLARLSAAGRALLHDVAGAWRHAVARREFERVDDATLRDLGIHRSEFDSYWAESHGQAAPTRRRLMDIGRS